MSIAAGIVARAQGQRDNGPAAREAACTHSVRAHMQGTDVRGHSSAPFIHDVDEAGVAARFLEVHAELL